jgi:hypothetical protein
MPGSASAAVAGLVGGRPARSVGPRRDTSRPFGAMFAGLVERKGGP